MSRFKNESGVAMIIALGVLLVLMALTGVALSAALKANSFSNRDVRTKRAFEAAQAGLQATVYRLNMQVNSSQHPISTLNNECIGAPSVPEESVKEVLEPPASGSIDCYPYHESLGNGASYTTWTTTVFSGAGTCAGQPVGASNSVNERCVTSEGIVEQGGQKVTHRVQERIAAFNGKPVFSIAGVTGEKGVWLRNSTEVLGPISTNGQLKIEQSAKASSCVLGPQGKATITKAGAVPPNNTCSILKEWSTLGLFSIVSASEADGNQRIENFFTGKGEADKFTGGGCTKASPETCGWNREKRTLNLPNGVTWELGGASYNFCSLLLKGSSQAVLAQNVKTSIYIDSASDPGSSCPSKVQYLSVENQANFINNSAKLAGSPLLHDTTALKIWIWGPSDVTPDTLEKNACTTKSDITCVVVGQGTAFYGTIYAPTSDIEIGNKGSFFGAIAGQTVTYNNPAIFQEDQNVPSIVTTGALGIYFPTAWTECGSPMPPASGDPMASC
jgi:Tfp pilus assembly protein PilX